MIRNVALTGTTLALALTATTGATAVASDEPVKPIPAPSGSRVAGTNDTYRYAQWHLDQMGVESLWWQNVTGKGVTVAVVDSGVNGHHSDLRGQVLPGWDSITQKRGGWTDGYGHGTAVAAQIAAVPNNGTGMAGMAPKVKILPIRASHRRDGQAYAIHLARGIRWAAKRGAQVINVSFGGPLADRTPREMREYRAALRYASKRGAVVVVSAGNDRRKGNAVNIPAAIPGVLAVGATNKNRQVTSFSNHHRYVRIAAPGQDIIAPWRGGQWVSARGTSFSAPLVAAEAAMVIQASGGRRHGNAVINTILRTADDVGPRGRDSDTGYGIINPQRAVADARRR